MPPSPRTPWSKYRPNRCGKSLTANRSSGKSATSYTTVVPLPQSPIPGGDGQSCSNRLRGARGALLEQPEFSDPERLRELFGALERGERLVDLLEGLLEGEGVSVSLGDELDTHGLGGCAMVAAPYGDSAGILGVIGPARMDYGRIIPLVDYCSQIVTDKLSS